MSKHDLSYDYQKWNEHFGSVSLGRPLMKIYTFRNVSQQLQKWTMSSIFVSNNTNHAKNTPSDKFCQWDFINGKRLNTSSRFVSRDER